MLYVYVVEQFVLLYLLYYIENNIKNTGLL